MQTMYVTSSLYNVIITSNNDFLPLRTKRMAFFAFGYTLGKGWVSL